MIFKFIVIFLARQPWMTLEKGKVKKQKKLGGMRFIFIPWNSFSKEWQNVK